MKFRIRNEFSSTTLLEEHGLQVSKYDYDKFMDGLIVEFNTEDDLCKFMQEANRTIKIVGEHRWGYITDVDIVRNWCSNNWEIQISYERWLYRD